MNLEKISYQVVVDGDVVGTFDTLDKARNKMREQIKEIRIVKHHHTVTTMETKLNTFDADYKENNDERSDRKR